MFYPDPDFLLAINQNIRTNNDALESDAPPEEEGEDEQAMYIESEYNAADRKPIVSKPAPEERQEIISCGSDVQVVEADGDDEAGDEVRNDEPRRALGATDSVLAPADEPHEQANALQHAYL